MGKTCVDKIDMNIPCIGTVLVLLYQYCIINIKRVW